MRRKRSHVINPNWFILMRRNTVVNATGKKHLENTKYKLLGGCFSVTASSVFWNNFPNNYFQYADWRINCSELCSVILNNYLYQNNCWVSNVMSFPYGFEHEFGQAIILNMTNKCMPMLTTKLLLEPLKWNTKVIFTKARWLLFLRNTSGFPRLRLWT